MRNQEATIETSLKNARGKLLERDEYLSESEWDARCARSYWQALADTAPQVTTRTLRFDLRRAVQQLRAVFSTGTR